MRLHLLLPTIGTTIPTPQVCRWCQSSQVGHWQTVPKPLRDTRLEQVIAERYGCRACGRTFRVYPPGVTHAATSQRLRGMAVLLYLLGLSYGAVALALSAFGYPWSKTSVYDAVQAAAAHVPGLRREAVFNGVHTPALAGDLTSVRCKGKWLPLGMTVDDLSGQVLTIDALSGEDAATLQAWMTPIAEQVGARLLITDDADSFKQVAAALGVPQQVCKAHVVRNTEALIEALTPLAAQDRDGSLAQVGVAPAQAVADLEQLGHLIHHRQPEDAAQLLGLHRRYLAARAPETRRDCQPGLSAAPPVPGPLESVEQADPLSDLAGAARRTNRWDQQRLRARHWLVDQRALSPHARLQAGTVRRQC